MPYLVAETEKQNKKSKLFFKFYIKSHKVSTGLPKRKVNLKLLLFIGGSGFKPLLYFRVASDILHQLLNFGKIVQGLRALRAQPRKKLFVHWVFQIGEGVEKVKDNDVSPGHL